MKLLFTAVLLTIGLFGQLVFSLSVPRHQEFIVQGTESTPFSYPFICSLQVFSELHNFREHMCGASILNQNWLLTSAHCFAFPIRTRFYDVKCGSWDLSVTEESRQDREIQQVIPHANFSYGESIEYFEFDIALIQLQTPLVFNQHVGSLALAPPGFMPTGNARKIGWGSTNANIALPSNRLHEANLPIIPRDQCEAFYTRDRFPIFETTICSGFLAGGAALCDGDSGGPLLFETPNRLWIHLGVAYWTVQPCGSGANGHISTNQFLVWISQNMQATGDTLSIVEI